GGKVAANYEVVVKRRESVDVSIQAATQRIPLNSVPIRNSICRHIASQSERASCYQKGRLRSSTIGIPHSESIDRAQPARNAVAGAPVELALGLNAWRCGNSRSDDAGCAEFRDGLHE